MGPFVIKHLSDKTPYIPSPPFQNGRHGIHTVSLHLLSQKKGKVSSVDSNNIKPSAPGEDNISDSRNNYILDTSSTAPGNFKLTFSLLFIQLLLCPGFSLLLFGPIINSSYRMQVLAHTIELFSLSLTHTHTFSPPPQPSLPTPSFCLHFSFSFPFLPPAFLTLSASFPSYLPFSHLLSFLHTPTLLMPPSTYTYIHTILSGHFPLSGSTGS